MSKPKLVDPRDTGSIDVASRLSPEHRAHLDLLGSKYAMFSGWTMKDDDDPADDDEGDDDVVELEPDDLIMVGDKKLTVGQIQKIMAGEKRQGKKAGRKTVLDELGFETVEEAKAALAKAGKVPAKSTKDDDGKDDDADRRATERETAAEARERKAKVAERKADLKGALSAAGVDRADLDDALALLDRAVDTEYDDDDLDEAVEALEKRRPGLFGNDDEDDKDDKAEKPKAKARIPDGGRPRSRNKPQGRKFGAGGLERARSRGFIKD